MTLAVLTSRPSADCGDTRLLTARVARGEAGSFEELVRLFQTRVTRLAHRLLGWNGEIEDVVQDVFVTAFKSAAGFKGDCSLWTWLTVITLNRCRTHRRQQKMMQRVMQFLASRRRDESSPADKPALADETAAEVRAAVAALRPIHREVIVLFYLEHKSIDEMSILLGAATNAIEVRLHRARARLRDLLKNFNAG